MEAVLLVIHLIVALAIIFVVLIQPAESGGFLGNSGSMSNILAPRRSADVLTRVTAVLATCFFATSLSLAILAGHKPAKTSILDAATPLPITTDASKKGSETKNSSAPSVPVSK